MAQTVAYRIPKTIGNRKVRTEEEMIAAALEKDRRMDHSRKTPTKSQIDRIVFEKMLNYEDEDPNVGVIQVRESSDGKKKDIDEDDDDEWDVKIGDKVSYFDPNLSYEITGYRPITKDKGLDFDPSVFTEAARYYKTHGRYTDLIPDTFLHIQHWTEEFKRCLFGYLVGKYKITGENYFFLNYFRIPSVLDKSGEELQEESFPTFLAKLYEYFHYLELCRKLQLDGVAFKSRGVGASLIAASNCACAYTFHKGTRNIVTAFADRYVDDTLSKVWLELDFLNTCTEGAFRHVRMKIDTNRIKKASKVDSDKNESGWGAIIEGVTADEPRKLRGARTYNLYFEEAGSNPKLIATYLQSRALVVINGYRVGSRFVFGTAGDTGPNLAGLKDMFYNPEEYLILPYYHNYTKNHEYVFTGYFIPSYTMWFGTPDNPGFDKRGVVDEDRAKQYYEGVWKNIKDPKKLIIDKAEYCFTPEDAFVLEGENHFDQEKIIDQKSAIEIHKTVDRPQGLKLTWQLTDGVPDINKRPNSTVVPELESDIKFTEMPLLDLTSVPFNNLYVIGCLTPGEKVMTTDGLKNCEDVTLDDKLYSIEGKPVDIINLQRYYKEDEDVYKIKLNNIFRTTTFTKEHPIYCSTPKKHYRSSKIAKQKKLPYSYYTYDFCFKRMSDVKVGDFVKVPNIYLEEKPIPFNMWEESDVRTDFKIGNHLDSLEFWWLIGLLLGDGWAKNDNRGLGIVFNKNELVYANKCTKIIKDLFNRKLTLNKDKEGCIEYGFNSTSLNKFFSTNFGRGAKNKHIPEWVKFLPKELKLNLILGYLASDGCLCKSKNSLNFVSCSYKLLEDVLDILFSLGIISTVYYLRSKESSRKIAGRTKPSIINKAWTLDIHGEMINKFKKMITYSDLKLDKWEFKEFTNHAIPRCFFEDDSLKYIYIRISSIEHSKYTGFVYNYHCDTSTFMCKYIPTHNCDGIDADKSTSSGQTDVSKFCVIVYRRQMGLLPPKPVAYYKKRPKTIKEAWEVTLKLALFYNAKVLVEATRTSVIQYFILQKKLSLLMHRPRMTANSSKKTNFNQYGVPTPEHVILHYLELMEQYVSDYCEQIQFVELLDELLSYSYENKRKFDMVAAFGMALLADEELLGKTAKVGILKPKKLSFGYYKNEYGQALFGEIKQTNLRYEFNRREGYRAY